MYKYLTDTKMNKSYYTTTDSSTKSRIEKILKFLHSKKYPYPPKGYLTPTKYSYRSGYNQAIHDIKMYLLSHSENPIMSALNKAGSEAVQEYIAANYYIKALT